MPNVAEEPVLLNVFQTRHPDQAAAAASQVYAATHFSIGDRAPGFQLRVSNAQAGHLLAGTSHNGFGVRIRSEPVGHFVSGLVYEGQATLRTEHRAAKVMAAGQVWRFSHDEQVDIAYGAGSVAGALGLPLDAIAEAAAEQTDGEPATVRFLDDSPTDPAVERYWAQLIRTTYQQATTPDSVLTRPLIRSHLTRTLARAALLTFPNTTMTAHYLPGAGFVGPATLRRAVAHVHAHAGQPLTLLDLAQVAGISPRALQKAFVQHYGCSPMTYLRRVRLEGAHRDLQAADPARGDRVRTIAARWGFAHLGRFGTAYQQHYRVAPSVTLRG